MGVNISGRFETRRDAEMAVERLVQKYEIERTDIFVVAPGEKNSAGARTAGSDVEAAEPSPERRTDATLNGPIEVSVDLQDEERAATIRSAFAEFGVRDVQEG